MNVFEEKMLKWDTMPKSIYNARQFLRLAEMLKVIVDTPVSWETKFKLIFPDLRDELEITGIKIEWYNPDCGYDDDVLAFADAVEEKAKELRKVIDVINAIDEMM